MPDLFRIEVDIEGAGVITFDKKELRRVLRQAGQEVAAAARSMIRSSSGGGRYYGRRQAGAIIGYEASAPGTPPASRTGALAGSIHVKATRRGDGVSIRADEYYGKFLETGAVGGGPGRRNRVRRDRGVRRVTPTSIRILQPRPYLTAALEERRASIEQRLRAAIVDGVQFVREK